MKNNMIIKSVKPFLTKHEPELLIAMGISGMIFTVIYSVKATFTASKDLDLKKQKLGRSKLTPKEIFQTTWKSYLPAVISASVSIPCIIAGNRVSNKRNMALAAAYTMTESALQEYQDKAKELIGEKKFEQLQESISGEKVNKTYKDGISNVTLIGDGESLFFEPLSGRYFKTNWNRVSKAANDLNANALSNLSGIITLGEWYDILGLPCTALDDELGWDITNGKQGIIDISIDSVLTPENQPCGSIRYNSMPKKI